MRNPGRHARTAALLLALVLHGALLATPWSARVPRAARPQAQAPLQVMLLVEQPGRGKRLLAPSEPVADKGARAVPQPPPTPAVTEAPAPVALAQPDSAEPAAPPAPTPPALPDRPALPTTAPDLAPLLAQGAPTGPIALRLHIDADGRVAQVEVTDARPEDAEFAERLAELLRRTPHIPARRDGQDVASTKNVRLTFSTRA